MADCAEPDCTYPAGTRCTMTGCPGRKLNPAPPFPLEAVDPDGAVNSAGRVNVPDSLSPAASRRLYSHCPRVASPRVGRGVIMAGPAAPINSFAAHPPSMARDARPSTALSQPPRFRTVPGSG